MNLASLARAMAVAAACLLASCANGDFSTVSNPATVKLQCRGSGMDWDRFQLVSAQVDPDALHRARGCRDYLFDPGPRELAFRFVANRGTMRNMLGNMKTADVWKTTVELEAGQTYLVMTAVDDRLTNVRFQMKEESSGKVIARSATLPLRKQEVQIGPMPTLYLTVH